MRRVSHHAQMRFNCQDVEGSPAAAERPAGNLRRGISARASLQMKQLRK